VLLGDDCILEDIHQTDLPVTVKNEQISIQSRVDKDTYLSTIREIQQHIGRGDIYELNYCQEFYAEQVSIDPVTMYQQLTSISPTPFAGFLKIEEHSILSASPERFLCKRGQKLISQPIKGTARRSTNPAEDEMRRSALKADRKEQAENVMIVDLVRNDLTKNAVPGTVLVEELFGIYSFPQVHQMISTISCLLREEIHIIDAIKNVFPMGSMTGAPKIKAMQLIETFERSKRAAYSGALGYIDPQGDFDFNVIIRSILYNANHRYLSFQVGGAITYAADPEHEYEECLLKASGILQTLQM
jgi:para-aminobenzoate synthetase component 1